MSEQTEEVLYGLEDDETLSNSIEEVTDRFRDGEPVEVRVFRRMKVNSARLADRLLEWFLEDLDEDYGDPENPTVETVPMKAAASQFVQAVLKEYVVWNCEPTGESIKTVGTGGPNE